ncbi:hypothetical protein Pen02_26660 [Plantactinospora endophytica]|uniref:Uncharacterized protein n=1 Tax=Plantactinospora endophytica TaxID=673535 RepID=A0ABQ4DZ49_9ACTN|nr:hypothetical protein Pen02_26660 [Plantactinospora endophytica]
MASGGDQGRDAETIRTSTADEPQVALAYTLQHPRLPAKIERDVVAVCARRPAVDRAIACTAADIETAVQHRYPYEPVTNRDLGLAVGVVVGE